MSDFYSKRQLYKEEFLDEYKKDIEGKDIASSIDGLFCINFAAYPMLSHSFLEDMRTSRDKCMKMMDISEEDILAFRTQRSDEEEAPDSAVVDFNWIQEIYSLQTVIDKAREKYQHSNDE